VHIRVVARTGKLSTEALKPRLRRLDAELGETLLRKFGGPRSHHHVRLAVLMEQFPEFVQGPDDVGGATPALGPSATLRELHEEIRELRELIIRLLDAVGTVRALLSVA